MHKRKYCLLVFALICLSTTGCGGDAGSEGVDFISPLGESEWNLSKINCIESPAEKTDEDSEDDSSSPSLLNYSLSLKVSGTKATQIEVIGSCKVTYRIATVKFPQDFVIEFRNAKVDICEGDCLEIDSCIEPGKPILNQSYFYEADESSLRIRKYQHIGKSFSCENGFLQYDFNKGF